MASLSHPSKMIANKSESNAYKDSANVITNDDNDDFTEEGSQFHTWEIGEESTFIQNSQAIEEVATIGTLQKSRSTYIHSDSEDEDELEEIEATDPNVPTSARPESGSVKKEQVLENPMSPARVPSKVLELRPLVSEEAIAEKEANIRNLFFKCKDILMAATVFTMAAKYEEKVINGDDMIVDHATEGINDEECLRENPSKMSRRNTPKPVAPVENKNKTNTELLLEKYNEEKNGTRSEEKEEYSLKDDVLLKASAKEEEPVRISIPKAGSSNDLNFSSARPRAEYKPLVHSGLRASPQTVITTSTKTVINTTSILDTNNIPQPPMSAGASVSLSARASSPAAAVAASSSSAGLSTDVASLSARGTDGEPSPGAVSSTSSKAKPRKKQTTTSSSSGGTGMSGGIAAQFSADIAKLAAPLGSGLTRHGTKIKTSSSAKLRGEVSGANGSSNTATFVVGDNVQNLLNGVGDRNLMSQSSSGVLMQTNTNSIKSRSEGSDEAIVNVRITKKEHKQAFSVPTLSEAITASAVPPPAAEPKNGDSPVRPSERNDDKGNSPARTNNNGESKSDSASPTTRDAVSSSGAGAASNKGFGRFKNNSSMVVDTRGGGGGAGGDVRASGEYHHGILPFTPTSTVPSVFQRSFSEPTNLAAEAPSPAASALSGSVTPRSPGGRGQGVGGSIRIAQQMPIAKAVAAGMAPGATYRGFKIPQQARQAINPSAVNTTSSNKLHTDLSSLEKEILKLSATGHSDDSRPPSARSPRPHLSHSTGELVPSVRTGGGRGDGGNGYDDSGDEGDR